MTTYMRLTLTDTLSFWNDYLGTYLFNPEHTQTFIAWYKLPDDWFEENKLKDDKLNVIFKHIYGENWLLGNGDGSRYQVLDVKEYILSNEESAQKPWLNEKMTCYVLSDNGSINKCQPDEF